ncbi:hypothetical protein EVJ58_g1671 [Rhodofomes roseus]|uniref:Major facilitator superfamily (MFS) profile domain-containing protein n=1 Tax=Rhodofomes roseus TaxID=34475 RepID=A0A4Y9YYK6_9APHY|nr:hypothetical protein EVJ58_g1671 [Rhodofomes roseus]
MSRLRTEDDNPTEDTPLLQADVRVDGGGDGKGPVAITPLPKAQISILFVLMLVEPILSQSIYPFINQLVSELDIIHGDEKKVGYYAGLIESIFYLTEVVFVIQWSRLSDYIGRKPVLLIGMAGATTSMICFGLSKKFWQLVLSRCILGALNGNVGAMQSVVGELTDSTNMAQVFALMPVAWSVGATTAPLIGGQLAKPHDRWPNVFGNKFWIRYPYFLPCAVAAACAALACLIAALFMKETLKRKKSLHSSASSCEDPEEQASETTVPLLTLLKHPRVLLSVANYGALCLLDIAYRAVQPLFFATPRSLGGLGLPPSTIGLILGSFGIFNGILQALWFAPLVRRFGPKHVHMAGLGAFIPLWILFPVIGGLAHWQGGMTPLVWSMVMLQQVVSVVMDTAYGCVFMYITSSAPNRSSLGGTNGIGQLVAAFVRAVGPASATSLFAVSLEKNWLGNVAKRERSSFKRNRGRE